MAAQVVGHYDLARLAYVSAHGERPAEAMPEPPQDFVATLFNRLETAAAVGNTGTLAELLEAAGIPVGMKDSGEFVRRKALVLASLTETPSDYRAFHTIGTQHKAALVEGIAARQISRSLL